MTAPTTALSWAPPNPADRIPTTVAGSQWPAPEPSTRAADPQAPQGHRRVSAGMVALLVFAPVLFLIVLAATGSTFNEMLTGEPGASKRPISPQAPNQAPTAKWAWSGIATAVNGLALFVAPLVFLIVGMATDACGDASVCGRAPYLQVLLVVAGAVASLFAVVALNTRVSERLLRRGKACAVAGPALIALALLIADLGLRSY